METEHNVQTNGDLKIDVRPSTMGSGWIRAFAFNHRGNPLFGEDGFLGTRLIQKEGAPEYSINAQLIDDLPAFSIGFQFSPVSMTSTGEVLFMYLGALVDPKTASVTFNAASPENYLAIFRRQTHV